jgi:hypothetical protein
MNDLRRVIGALMGVFVGFFGAFPLVWLIVQVRHGPVRPDEDVTVRTGEMVSLAAVVVPLLMAGLGFAGWWFTARLQKGGASGRRRPTDGLD